VRGAGWQEGSAKAEPEKKKRKKKKHDLSQVASVGFKFPGNFDVPKFNMFMSTLLQVNMLLARSLVSFLFPPDFH